MPTVYLRKDLYDAIIMHHNKVDAFVNRAVEKALKEEREGIELRRKALKEALKERESKEEEKSK